MSEKLENVPTTNGQNLETDTMSSSEKRYFRDYLFFFGGQQISILGSSIVSFALIWWLTITTQSELMLGIASFVSLGPFLLVAPFSGVIADRVNKKFLLLIVDSLQSLFTVILTIIFMIFYDPNSSQYTTLLIICIFVTLGLRGTMQAFHSPTVSSLLPIMVPQKQLSRMNGINYFFNGIINVIGPALGAVLLPIFGISLILWIDAITFGIAVIPLILIKIPSIKSEEEKKISFFTDFKEGIISIKQIKGMFALMIMATLINFFFSPVSTLLPLFINKVHYGKENNYALVMALLNAGVIIGGLFMSFFKGFKNKIRSSILCVTVLFIAQMVLVLVPVNLDARFWIIGIILFFGILLNPAANVSLMTVMQTLIPKEKIGRVTSVMMFLSMAITPIGNFLSGVIGEFVPLGVLFTASGLIGLEVMVLIYLLSPAKNLDNVINEIFAKREAEQQKQEKIDEKIEIIDENLELEKEFYIKPSEKTIPESINLD